jgi:hypothetical protein
MCNDVDINDFTLTSSAPSGHVNDLTGTGTPGPGAVSDSGQPTPPVV